MAVLNWCVNYPTIITLTQKQQCFCGTVYTVMWLHHSFSPGQIVRLSYAACSLCILNLGLWKMENDVFQESSHAS